MPSCPQLLRERGELDSRFGQATLGILLLQDIATVPFLVLLPLIEGNNAGGHVQLAAADCRWPQMHKQMLPCWSVAVLVACCAPCRPLQISAHSQPIPSCLRHTALMEGQDTMSLVAQLGPTALKTIGGLGAVLLGGRLLMRRCDRGGAGCVPCLPCVPFAYGCRLGREY